MNSSITTFFALIHFLCIASIALYGAHRLWLLVHWARLRKTRTAPPPPMALESAHVTIQLPLFNEKYVARQLIEAVAKIDWPQNQLEIQVLDDSTDETSALVDQVTDELSRTGTHIKVLRRDNRHGYKAGALQNGLRQARGNFVAVFDADFLPSPDFLKKTMPFFTSPRTGMVQARWTFTNFRHSWLTRLQALLLRPHFDIEHRVRFSRGLFFNFNGTAGIWRKETILSAGGWQHDTVTEDLDLSYRAQLKGWEFIYLHNYGVRSELPANISSFRRQQQRWAMGAVQTARKILPRLFRSNLSPAIKIEAGFHLLANLGWLSGTLATLTLYPALKWRLELSSGLIPWLDLPLFGGATCAVILYFLLHTLAGPEKGMIKHVALIPVFSIGFAPGPALGVFQGLFKKGGLFERTPKYGEETTPKETAQKSYHKKNRLFLFTTALFFLCSLTPLALAVTRQAWSLLPFLLVFPAGFALVFAQEMQEFRQ